MKLFASRITTITIKKSVKERKWISEEKKEQKQNRDVKCDFAKKCEFAREFIFLSDYKIFWSRRKDAKLDKNYKKK